jgi:excisionase family DNA binding protein
MHDYFGPEPEHRIKLTPPQLVAYFQALKQRAAPRERLPDISRLAHRAEASASRVTTVEAKARHLGLAVSEIDLIVCDVTARFRELEAAGNVDDPDVFWDYVEQAQRTRDSLALKIESLILASDHCTPTTSPAATVAAGLVPAIPATSQQSAIPKDCMNIRELAAYLRVSISTVYHRSASGRIPVNRIGTRLVFRRAEVEAWLQAEAGSSSK